MDWDRASTRSLERQLGSIAHRLYKIAQLLAFCTETGHWQNGRSRVDRLSFAKMLASRRISEVQPWFGAESAITRPHGQPVLAVVRSALTCSPKFSPPKT